MMCAKDNFDRQIVSPHVIRPAIWVSVQA